MRKFILFIVCLVVITGCGTLENEPEKVVDKPQENTSKDSTVKTQSINEVENIIPKKRTVDEIMDGGFPWYYLSLEKTEAYMKDGETVFLIEDGEELLKNISVSAESELEEDNPNTREELVKSWSEWLTLYLENVEPLGAENNSYFNKVREVIMAAEKQEYDKVIQLSEEAKTLLQES